MFCGDRSRAMVEYGLQQALDYRPNHHSTWQTQVVGAEACRHVWRLDALARWASVGLFESAVGSVKHVSQLWKELAASRSS
jgi:hypothetical protein